MLKPACLAVLSGTVALASCAAPSAQYPSLAIRDSERVSGTMAVPASQTYEAPSSAVKEAASILTVEDARFAHQQFLRDVPAAREIVAAARGAERDSEAWIQAQLALAGLENSRAKLMIALADLDALTVEAAVAGEQFTTLAADRDEIAALADRETQIIAAMLEGLAP